MVADNDWGDIDSSSKTKSQAPKLFCCCLGCLVPIVLIALAFGWVASVGIEGAKPELQWVQLKEVLPAEPQAEENLNLKFGIQMDWFDVEFYVLVDSFEMEREQQTPKLVWILLQHDAEEAQELIEVARSTGGAWTPPGAAEPLETLKVQGHELPCAYSEQSGMPDFAPTGANPAAGSEDGPAVVLLLPTLSGEMDLNLFVTGEGVEEVTPEDIEEFLSNFRLPELR